MPLLRLENVTLARDGRTVLENVSLELTSGEKVGLIGPNGVGKTSLLHLLVGLLKPQQGSIFLKGQKLVAESDFVTARRSLGLLFQDSDDQLFCPTVLEDVAFGPLNLGADPKEAESTAHATLARLGIEKLADRVTYRLSGGEKRLVALATVLAMQPEILLLDEPTTGLDFETTERIGQLLAELPQAMLIVSHDTDFLAPLTDRTVIL